MRSIVYSGTAKCVESTLGVKCSGYCAARVRTPSIASGERRLGPGFDEEDAEVMELVVEDAGSDAAIVFDADGDGDDDVADFVGRAADANGDADAAVAFGTACSVESGLASPNCARRLSTLKIRPGFVAHLSFGSLLGAADTAFAFLS
jgi:hypothetical protein